MQLSGRRLDQGRNRTRRVCYRLPWPGGLKPPDSSQIVPVAADLLRTGHTVATAATGERSHLPAVAERQLRERPAGEPGNTTDFRRLCHTGVH